MRIFWPAGTCATPVCEWHLALLADERREAGILGVHRDRGVPQDRLRPRRRHLASRQSNASILGMLPDTATPRSAVCSIVCVTADGCSERCMSETTAVNPAAWESKSAQAGNRRGRPRQWGTGSSTSGPAPPNTPPAVRHENTVV